MDNKLSSQLAMLQESSLGMDNFFCAQVFEYEAILMGNYSNQLFDKCIECNYTFEFEPNTHSLKAKNEVITIILILR